MYLINEGIQPFGGFTHNAHSELEETDLHHSEYFKSVSLTLDSRIYTNLHECQKHF